MGKSLSNASEEDEWGYLALRELGPFLLPSAYKKPLETLARDKDGWGMDDTNKAIKRMFAPNRSRNYEEFNFDARGGVQTFAEDTLNFK